jgi:hypothetical protein
MRLNDSASTGIPASLSDEALQRISNRTHSIAGWDRKAQAEEPYTGKVTCPACGGEGCMDCNESGEVDPEANGGPPQQKDEKIALKASTITEATQEIASSGFKSIGSAIYKKAHALWSLEPDGAGKYALVRHAAEPTDFPVEDDPDEMVHEGKSPFDDKEARFPVHASFEETLVRTASNQNRPTVDRYGVTIKVGSNVSYPLGGEFVTGRVASITALGHLDVQLEGQLDVGVPCDFVTVDRRARSRVAEEGKNCLLCGSWDLSYKGKCNACGAKNATKPCPDDKEPDAWWGKHKGSKTGQADPKCPKCSKDLALIDGQVSCACGYSKKAQEMTEPSQPDLEPTPSENDLHMHKDIKAQKKLAFEQYWASYGAVLADQVLTAPNLSAETKSKMARIASANSGSSGRLPEKREKIASWESLTAYAGPKAVETVRRLVFAGLSARVMSKELNMPLAMTYDLRADLNKMPRKHATVLRQGLKEMKTASVQDKVALELMKTYGADVVEKWASIFELYKQGSLKLQKVALDTTAKDYWKMYFGEYGQEFVRDVKRRLKADLVAAKLQMQAVDSETTKYYQDYYGGGDGDYGTELTREVDRAVANSPKGDVKPEARKASAMNANAPTMVLPPDGRGKTPARRDIFAGVKLILDEKLPGTTNRVGLAKVAAGWHVLIRSGNASKVCFREQEDAAKHAFQTAVRAHIIGG